MEEDVMKLKDLIDAFFGCDAAYYGVDGWALACHLIDNGVTFE